MSKFDISIIVINYNSSEFTTNCIRSILMYDNTDLSYNIIVVDNNSNIDDFNKLNNYCSNIDKVILIRSKLNLGFSGGNMQGVQYADAKYLLFLNNDTIFLNNCLSILHTFMLQNTNVGICTAQMFDGDNKFQNSFGYFPTLKLKLLGTFLLRIISPEKYPSPKKIYINPLKVDFVTGSAMFVDYEKFSIIGGFDTNYFLYCEEEDIAMKFKNAGYEVWLVPEAKFQHFMGKSTIRNWDIERENYISLLYYHRKNTNIFEYIALKIFYFIKNIKKVYKDKNYLYLAFFILLKGGLKYSLRHKIKLGN